MNGSGRISAGYITIVAIAAIVITALSVTLVYYGPHPISTPQKINTGIVQPHVVSSIEELEDLIKSSSSIGWSTQPRTPTPTAALPKSMETSHSTTNVQVEGVDEADLVKTDGSYIYYATSSGPAPRIVIVKAKDLKISSEISIDGWPLGLYVYGDELIVMYRPEILRMGIVPPWLRSETYLKIYKITDKAEPKLVYSSMVSGTYLSSRLLNGTIYMVASQPAIIYKGEPVMPRVSDKPLPPTKILYVGGPARVYTTILAVNLSTLKDNVETVLSGPATRIYMSRDDLYLVQQEYEGFYDLYERVEGIYVNLLPKDIKRLASDVLSSNLSAQARIEIVMRIVSDYMGRLPAEEKARLASHLENELSAALVGISPERTVIYRFSLNDLNVTLKARGEVPGRVLDQFAMDERAGTFRIATTTNRITGVKVSPTNPAQFWTSRKPSTGLYVLSTSDLELLGKVDGLAPGEMMYAARYVGDAAFLVTFRRVDPLFAIDLSDADNPRVIGRTKIPGYSEYLHPYGDLLVGVGVDTDERGHPVGLKISLFNISKLDDIRELDSMRMLGSYTEVFRDHHAYMTLDGWFAMPVKERMGTNYLLVVKVDEGGLKVLCEPKLDMVRRSVFINDTLYLLSDKKILAADFPSCKILRSLELSSSISRDRAKIAYYSISSDKLRIGVSVQLPNTCYKLEPSSAHAEDGVITLETKVLEPPKDRACVEMVYWPTGSWELERPSAGRYTVLVKLVYTSSGSVEKVPAGTIVIP